LGSNWQVIRTENRRAFDSRCSSAMLSATKVAAPRLPGAWIPARVPPAQVAEWAGHSVAVLLRVYAKCIDGQDQIAKRRIEDALRESDNSPAADTGHGDAEYSGDDAD